ncbi:MAG: spermidine/putrescine ABC transporter substrate-binding protein [Solirubrobacterales bacterium]
MRGIGRRAAGRLAVAGAVLGAAVGLVACGGGGGIEQGANTGQVSTAKNGPVKGSLTISNWPLYIDSQTVPNFEKKTGVSVKYIEDVNDNVEFFGKLRPQLASGTSGGRSIVVLTDWMAGRMIDLGYVQKLDKSALPNVEKNLRQDLRHPSFDPNRDFSVPWQSGMTGLIVRTDLAPDVHSINDLFDPKYKGKVTMLTEMRDTVPLVMKADGVDPNKATQQDWLDAIDKLKKAVDDGQIRRFTGNDYARDLTKGDVVAAIGWSGDAIQLQADNPNIEWRMPTQGCMLWSDNMEIPVGAPNTPAALAWMNYVYDPEVAAKITEYVNYVSPVDGVKQVLLKKDPELANNELIFPSASFTKNCSTQPKLTGAEEETVTQAFESVLTG